MFLMCQFGNPCAMVTSGTKHIVAPEEMMFFVLLVWYKFKPKQCIASK